MSVARQVQESPLVQGEDEAITYTLTTTPWGSSPSSSAVKAYDITDGGETDVSGTVLNGSPSEVGDVITLPSVESLTAGKRYRIDVKFTAGGNTLEAYAIIEAEN